MGFSLASGDALRAARNLLAGLLDQVGETHGLALALEGAQRRVHGRERDVAVPRGQLARPSGAAALGEHLELGPEHVALRNGQHLALGVAVLAALDVERRALVQKMRRVPGAEIDLV